MEPPQQSDNTDTEPTENPLHACTDTQPPPTSTSASAAPSSEILSVALPEEFATSLSVVYASLRSSTRDKSTHEQARNAISHNASNPSAWLLLRESADALSVTDSSVWQNELSYTAKILSESGKNYQAWEHRRYAASKSDLLQPELEFCDVVLQENPKNYHAWAHRAWVVRQGIAEGEGEDTEWYIRNDVRNNSAWNHRWLVVGASKGEEEMDFTVGMILLAPRNESAWNYALALSRDGVGRDIAIRCARRCIEEDPACIPARRFLVLCGEDVSKQCEILANIDTIRNDYWHGRGRGFIHPQT